MQKKNFLTLASFVGLLAMLFFTGCGDDEIVITGDAMFTYQKEGYTVTFTNESDVTPPVTYSWTFGDDNTSEEENPVHEYASEGTYTATLTVTDQLNETHVYSEDIVLEKYSGINFNDGSLDDWGGVTDEKLIVPIGEESGAFKTIKFEYDANYIYVYLNWAGNNDNLYTNALFIDFDNSSSTGFYKAWYWSDYGADYIVQYNNQGDTPEGYTYTGEDGSSSWSWGAETLPAGSIEVGTIEQIGTTVALEVRLNRANIKAGSQNLLNDKVWFGMMLQDLSWNIIGYGPERQASLFELDMTSK